MTGRGETRPLSSHTSGSDACGCVDVETASSAGQPHAQDVNPCTDCLPGLSSPQDRLAALRQKVRSQTEPLVTLTHLLQLCRDEHRVLWERVNDPGCRRAVALHLRDVDARLPDAGAAPGLDADVRAAFARALAAPGDLPVVLVARRIAEMIDDRYSHTFVDFFRRHSPYLPAVGDPLPLGAPDLPRISDLSATSPPWRLANRLDQTRRIRLAGEWAVQYRVVFDYSLYDLLSGVVDADTIIATCHPNQSLDELSAPMVAGGRRFPVAPVNLAAQRAVLTRLMDTAAQAGASIIVLPELCVDEALATTLQAWVRGPGPTRVVVAGSYHHEDPLAGDGTRRRRNTALTWIRGSEVALEQDKHSPAEHPIAEDVQPQGWPEMRVYVTADGWHMVVAICRDLLNPEAVHALTEAGANLVLVPAMSESLVSFGGPSSHLVGAGQALVAVANNPSEWPGPVSREVHRPARGLFGHPGFGQQIRLVTGPDPAPGIALLTVRSGRVRWISLDGQQCENAMPPVTARPRPDWAAKLATATTTGYSGAPVAAGPWRSAAVLVPLIDAPDGPRVLLTRRAADLADYPDRVVFPGGLVEPADRTIVDAALREAEEEVGIDGATVDVLGVLHPLALLDTGYVVTPVVGWVVDPPGRLVTNQSEVAATVEVPLSLLSRQRRPELAPVLNDTAGADGSDLEVTLGALTAAVLDQLIGILAAPGAGVVATS